MLAIACISHDSVITILVQVGVATQNPRLEKALVIEDKMYRVCNFHKATIQSCLEIIGSYGTYFG